MIRALFRGLKTLIRKLLKLGAVAGAVLFLVRLFTRRPPAHDTENGPTDVASSRPSGSSASSASATTTTTSAAPSTEATVDTTVTESAAWVAPSDDGAAPASHPVKVKVASGIYHVPGGIAYDRTVADRCYVDAAAAEADGFRPSKR